MGVAMHDLFGSFHRRQRFQIATISGPPDSHKVRNKARQSFREMSPGRIVINNVTAIMDPLIKPIIIRFRRNLLFFMHAGDAKMDTKSVGMLSAAVGEISCNVKFSKV